MRFRFGRGLTLLRGGNSGTSKIGEDVLYITGLEERLRILEPGSDQEQRICVWICVRCFLKYHPGRSGRGGIASTGYPVGATLNRPTPCAIDPGVRKKKKTCGL